MVDVDKAVAEGRVQQVRSETVSVATTATRVARGRPTRTRILLVNKGLNAIHVHKRRGPTTTRGIRLDPSGGFLKEDWDKNGKSTWGEYWAIAETGATNLWVEEDVADAEVRQ